MVPPRPFPPGESCTGLIDPAHRFIDRQSIHTLHPVTFPSLLLHHNFCTLTYNNQQTKEASHINQLTSAIQPQTGIFFYLFCLTTSSPRNVIAMLQTLTSFFYPFTTN